jgi:hypothetical protein
MFYLNILFCPVCFCNLSDQDDLAVMIVVKYSPSPSHPQFTHFILSLSKSSNQGEKSSFGAIRMAGSDWEWLGMAENDREWMEMAGNE